MNARKALFALWIVVGSLVCAHARADVTFYAPFDESTNAATAGGNGTQLHEDEYTFVQGIKGNGVLLKSQVLSYKEPGNLDNARGSLEMWVKFVNADPTKHHHLFYEDTAGGEPGDQNMVMFTLSNGALFCKANDTRRHWFTARFPLEESMGRWRYIVLTWDKDKGMRMYVDGKMTMRDASWKDRSMNFKRESKQHEEIFFSNNQSDLVLDEIRVHDRVLNADEVFETFQSLHPLFLHSRPFLFNAGESRTITLVFDNTTDEPVTGRIAYAIQGPGERVALRETMPSAEVPASDELTVNFEFAPQRTGTYRLAYELGKMSRFADLTVLPKELDEQPVEAHPELELEPVVSIDCTEDHGPDVFMDDGTSRVVDSPLGQYRETGATSWSRLAYRFFIDEPETPYLAVVEYPDDKARIMEIMIDNRSNSLYQTVEAGLITGDEYPNDNSFHEYRMLFYPTDKECALIVMNWPVKSGSAAVGAPCVPAACRSIRVYKVTSDIPAVEIPHLPPEGDQRLVGYENEDASFAREFSGNLQGSPTFADLRKMMQRRVDYMRFVGQNLLVYPVYHYAGALYPSQRIAQAGKLQYHPGPWVELILNLCAKRGITFMPSICFMEIAELKSAPADKETIASGQDTPYLVSWKGEVNIHHNPRYNILHPEVQEHLVNLVDDLLDRYGDSPAFGGVSFWVHGEVSLWLPNLKWGYSDRNVNAFTQDTGVDVPGQAPDPQRFVKRYVFLTKRDPEVREQWIAWRCRKVKEAWMLVHDRLRAENENYIQNMELWGLWPGTRSDYARQDHWTPGDLDSVYEFYRESGVDVDLFDDAPSLYVGQVCYHNSRPTDGTYLSRDFEFAPARILPFRNQGRNAVWLEQTRRELDDFHRCEPMPGFWWDDGTGDERGHMEKSGGIMPHAQFYLEYYANCLANLDVRYITDGGITLTTLGHEDALREFIRAYRTIPAEPFPIFNEVNDPLCVRARQREDGYCFYLVNREFYPVTAQLSFDADGPFDLLDLPNDTTDQVQDATTVTVGPFRVLSFRAPRGVALEDVSVSVPPERLAWLEQEMNEFKRRVREVRELGFDDRRLEKEIAWAAQEVDRAWNEKRYSRLRHLLSGFHARKLRRILEDPEFRAFIAVPQEYKDAFMDPSYTIEARRVDEIPSIDSPQWADLVATDTFSETAKVDGRFQPKPAEEKTQVAIAYDDANLAVLFRCFDSNPDQIAANLYDHDELRLGDPESDSVEVFLSHAPENTPYYHFGANFRGSYKDRKAPDDAQWYNPDWTIRTKKRADRWDALLVFPFEELGKTPSPGDTWGLNLCRNRRGTNVTLRCDPQYGFHCPDYFAQLRF